jgi:Family of unknown function (DUF5317)
MSVAMIGAVLIALAVGLACGGSLHRLSSISLRWTPLLFEGLAIQLIFQLWDPPGLTKGSALAVVLLSNFAVLVFLAGNLRTPGVLLLGLGLALNVVVIAANDAMPVSPGAAETAGLSAPTTESASLKHERLNDDTRLPWLADVIPVPRLKEILSIGDIVLALGMAHLVYAGMRTGVVQGEGRRRRGVRQAGS